MIAGVGTGSTHLCAPAVVRNITLAPAVWVARGRWAGDSGALVRPKVAAAVDVVAAAVPNCVDDRPRGRRCGRRCNRGLGGFAASK